MKTFRNSSLSIFVILMLSACTNNPFILNQDIHSLEKKAHLFTGQSDQNNVKPSQDLAIFKQQKNQPYRSNAPIKNKQNLAVNLANTSTNNLTNDPYQDFNATNNTPSRTVNEFTNNGSVPYISTSQNTAQPQVVNELGVIQNAEEIVQLDYEQIEIRQILEDLADALGMSIVIDPSVSGKITMRTSPNQPLKNKDLWSVLNMLLNESGISLEKKAGLYYAKQSPLNLPLDIGYPSLIKNTDASLALQVTPLKSISAKTALTVLKPLIGPNSKVSQISQLNMLAIIGSSDQLNRINGLIQIIDSDPFKHLGIRLYKIKQAEAKEIATELESILKLVEGEKSSYKVLGLERINSLLVVAPPKRGFKAVDRSNLNAFCMILSELTTFVA